MKKAMVNPYLPLWEHIPDGEPHVFGDRLYLFGSHDKFGGRKYCMKDYVCWSVPVDDLSDWRREGVIYRKKQDPKSRRFSKELWAPDVCRGNDGRYYLYYCTAWAPRIGVAVCDTPAGQYQFYGYVCHEDGSEYGSLPGETAFDPGVLHDDDGKIWLYTAFSTNDAGLIRIIKQMNGVSLYGTGNQVLELADDMRTVRSVKPLIPGIENAAGTGFEGHEFYEASSMRKFNGKYYFIYSSFLSHELAYAVSDAPDQGFTFGGTLHSNGNIGIGGQKKATYYWGNNHGSVERVGEKYYLFGHRQTNYHESSRQGVAEEIQMDETGHFLPAEMTSCGLNGGPLPAEGSYCTAIAYVLYRGEGAPKITATSGKKRDYPMITQLLADGIEKESAYIANIRDDTKIGFKYFRFFREAAAISVEIRGKAEGELLVYQGEKQVGTLPVSPSRRWRSVSAPLAVSTCTAPLYFWFRGKGYFDWRTMEF